MKLGYGSLVISLGIALSGCNIFSVQGQGFGRTSATCGSGVGCNVQVQVLVPAGLRCYLKVNVDELGVTGSSPATILWTLDPASQTAGYRFAQVVGVVFADAQFSNAPHTDGKTFAVIDAKTRAGQFKYTVNVIGPNGLSYCTALDPFIYNQ